MFTVGYVDAISTDTIAVASRSTLDRLSIDCQSPCRSTHLDRISVICRWYIGRLSVIWKKCYMKFGVWNEMNIRSSLLLDNLSNCLMNLKNSGDSTGFEPMTSAMPVQCSNQLSYEVTQLRAGQFVGLMFSRERIVVWKKCLNCPASARIISSFDVGDM